MAAFVAGAAGGLLDTSFADITEYPCRTASVEVERVDGPENQAERQARMHRPLHPFTACMVKMLTTQLPPFAPVVLTGAAGTGKTDLLREVYHAVDCLPGWSVLFLMPTNGAKDQLIMRQIPARRVMTLDKFLSSQRSRLDNNHRFRPPSEDQVLERAIEQLATSPSLAYIRKRLRSGRILLVLDEAWVNSAARIDTISAVLQNICGIFGPPFGGLPVLFAGDNDQMSPVSTKEAPAQPFFYSPIFQSPAVYYVHELTEQFRCRDPHLESLLGTVASGSVDLATVHLLESLNGGPGRRRTIPLDAIRITTSHRRREDYTVERLQQLAGIGFRLYRVLPRTRIWPYREIDPSLLHSLGAEVLILAAPPPGYEGSIRQRVRFVNNTLRDTKDCPMTTNTMATVESVICKSNGSLLVELRLDHTGQIVVVSPTASTVLSSDPAVINARTKELKNAKHGVLPAYMKDPVDPQDPMLNPAVIATRYMFPFEDATSVTVYAVQGSTIPTATVVVDLSEMFQLKSAYVALSRVCTLDQLIIQRVNYDGGDKVAGILRDPERKANRTFLKGGKPFIAMMS